MTIIPTRQIPRKINQSSTAIWAVGIACITWTVPGPALGVYRAEFGDLTSYLLDICIPPAGTEAFVVPDQADMDAWQDVIASLLAGRYSHAADLADAQLYDLVQFTNTGTGCTYYVLVEQHCPGDARFPAIGSQPCRGLGTFAFNPHARRALNLQVPHVITDPGTRPESVSIFLSLEATFLQIAGTTRCANGGASNCSGTTETCGPEGPYHESDTAHFTRNFFQVTSTEVAAQLPDLTSISVHAFGACDDPFATSLAQISNGTGCGVSAVPNSIATQLSAAGSPLTSLCRHVLADCDRCLRCHIPNGSDMGGLRVYRPGEWHVLSTL